MTDASPRPEYSLWLVPPRRPRLLLSEVVGEFAPRLGVPAFVPHVTLLGDIACGPREARDGTREVAGAATPLDVVLDGFGTDETFFRAAYLEVRENDGLVRARRASERVFADRSTATRPFDPHLSLAYGSPDERTKREILDAARRRNLDTASFTVTRLTLAESSSELPIERWRIVEEVDLGG